MSKRSASQPVPRPIITKTFKMSEVKRDIHGKDHVFFMIHPSVSNLLHLFVVSSAKAFALAFSILLSLLLVDYIANPNDNIMWLLITHAAIILGIVVAIGAGYAILNHKSFWVDEKNARVIVSDRINEKAYDRYGIGFNEIEKVDILPNNNNMFTTSKLAILARGEYFIAAESGDSAGELKVVRDWLIEVVQAHQ